MEQSGKNQDSLTQRRKVAKVAKQTKEFLLSGLCALATLRETLLVFQRLLVAGAVILTASSVGAVTRPHYGGTLRVELQAQVPSFVPSEQLEGEEAELSALLQNLVCDRLVRLDAEGHPQPGLALSWTHDAQNVKWRFTLRPGVKWHDGSPFTAADAVAALAGTMPPGLRDAGLQADGETLEIEAGDQDSKFLQDLATSARWVIRSGLAGAEPPGVPRGGIGTGPFRITAWEPGRRAVLQANDDYWGGRPYLDAIEFEMGRPSREQLIDLELDKADLVELDPAEARRAQQEGWKVWTSAPVELVCLRFNPGRPAARDQRLREAIASSIDRSAIQKVLVQNYGEVTGAILPQRLSGYAFLFPTAADLERARRLKAEIGSPPVLKVGYDRSDILARQVAERLAVNARDAGITLEVAPLAPGLRRAAGPPPAGVDAQVERARVDGPTLDEALGQALAALTNDAGLKPALPLRDPEEVYAAERNFLSTFYTVPLVYVPELVGLASRVRNFPPAGGREWQDWRLDEVWLEGGP